MDVQLPDWIREGERVAIKERSSGSFSRDMGYTMDAVDRLTPTQIVLTNGRRFKASSLVEVGGRSELADRNDERVKRWRVRAAIEAFGRKVDEIARQVRNDGQFSNEDALSQIGAAQRQLEKMIYRIAEDKLS